MPRGVYVRSAQARANMSAAAKLRAKTRGGAKPTTTGYGAKGRKFRNPTKYAQSDSGHRHALNPLLQNAPVRGPGGKVVRGPGGKVFFNQTKANKAIAKRRATRTGKKKI